MSPEKIREGLVVLIQHNLVRAVNVKDMKSDRQAVPFASFYTVKKENILMRYRFPRYVMLVRDLIGSDVAATIVLLYMIMGQLRFDALLMIYKEEENERHKDQTDGEIFELVKGEFCKLIDKGLLEYVEASDSLFKDPFDAMEGSPRGRKRKYATMPREDETLPPEVVGPAPEERLPKRRRQSKTQTSASEESGPERAGEDYIEDEKDERENFDFQRLDFENIYRLNFNTLIKLECAKEVFEFTKGRLGDIPGQIVRVMLDINVTRDESSKPYGVVPLKFQDVFEKLQAKLQWENFDYSEFLLHVGIMARPENRIIKLTGEGDKSCILNLQWLLTELHKLTIQNIIYDAYGQEAARVFNIVLKLKMALENRIVELALMPPQAAKEAVYRLFRAGILEVQEVPKTSEYIPGKTIHLWYVNLDHVSELFVGRVLRSNVCLKKRLEDFVSRNGGLIEKVEFNFSLSLYEKIRIEQIRRIAFRIETALLENSFSMFVLKRFPGLG